MERFTQTGGCGSVKILFQINKKKDFKCIFIPLVFILSIHSTVIYSEQESSPDIFIKKEEPTFMSYFIQSTYFPTFVKTALILSQFFASIPPSW